MKTQDIDDAKKPTVYMARSHERVPRYEHRGNYALLTRQCQNVVDELGKTTTQIDKELIL